MIVKVTITDNDDQIASATRDYTVSSLPVAPTVTLTDINTTPSPQYEKGDQINYRLVATIPGRLKAASVKKIVNSNEIPSTLAGISAGDTTLSLNLAVDVTENAGQQVTVQVTLIDKFDQDVTVQANYTVAPVGQGGGSTVPILTGVSTVTIGSENSVLGGFLATSKGAAGVFKQTSAQANESEIDITLGVGNINQLALISPDARQSAGLFQTTAPRITFLKAEPNGPTDLSVVRAVEVENNITASTSKTVQITVGSTYSFMQNGAAGKKGYIRVVSITGTGTDRTAQIQFVVQK